MNFKFKNRWKFGVLLLLLILMGCEKHEEDSQYLRCNITSNGHMAENENGYFFTLGDILYYADKDNLEQWVAVCNKPDCAHLAHDYKCNAYLPLSAGIWQKDGKLYGFDVDEVPYIYEVTLDGSGRKKVYEIPLEFYPKGVTLATFQDKFILHLSCLDENGLYEEQIICLEEDTNGKLNIHTLYENHSESVTTHIHSANRYWSIRGEDLILTSLYLKDGDIATNNLCRVNGEKVEPLNLPEDISKYGAYLNGDIFTYYNQQEGFFEYNIKTGEKKLIFENQLKDAQGYILSEDCMVECNRYLGAMPEEAFLRVYNGEEWMDVEVPKEVANRDNPFYPFCITSDRLFFRMTDVGDDNLTTVYLYYMMLGEESSELTYAGKIGDGILEEPTSEETTQTEEDVYANFEETTVFESSEYIFKITDVYLNDSNDFCVDMYFENRSDDKSYGIMANHWVINGIQCETSWGDSVAPNKTKQCKLVLKNKTDHIIAESQIPDFYSASEYTDIEIGFHLTCKLETIEEKFFHIYPQGEENATTFKREPQDSDIVLVNDENISIIVTGYEECFVPGDTINVLVENKTNQYMLVKVEEASANGISIEEVNIPFGFYYVTINPGATAMYPMTLFDNRMDGPYFGKPVDTFFTINEITSIEEIEMRLRAYPCDRAHGAIGDDYVNKIFILNP